MKQQSKMKQTEIEKVFEELKLNNLINKKSQLLCNNSESNLRGTRNKIYYHPLFANLNKNNLRFLLLHEEAHNTTFQNSTWVLILSFVSGLVSYFFLRHIFFSIIILFFVFFLFRGFIKKDELNADLLSAEKLKKYYHILSPSKIMKDTIMEFSKIECKRNFRSKFSSIIIKILGYHPPFEERIKIIKRKVG